MKRRMITWGLAALAAVSLAGFAALEPVPYTLACFQPDREARSFCLTQTWAMSVYKNLATLQSADPVYLEENEEAIVADYRQAFMSGMLPDQNFTPLQLRHMIEDLIRIKRGQPV